jgi:3-methyladenine DNA glycosylase AlkD
MSRAVSARVIERRLVAAARPSRGRALERFFKTAPGEYGEGDRFLGWTVPEVRRVAREYRDLPLGEIERLLESPWHEVRLLALIILVGRYERSAPADQRQIVRLYLRRTDRINNWDLVDVSAARILGAHLLTRSRSVIQRLARSPRLWERRIAVVATHSFIRNGQYRDTLALGARLSNDPEDLLHKAIGWMLREVGKKDEAVLRRFLDRRAGLLPRTSLRYAIERLPAAARRRYLAQPRTRARRSGRSAPSRRS